jgi:2-polyprenyl-3-methyl-5-hydroxy-6-metoxy-1,4-benzoquinol methylase
LTYFNFTAGTSSARQLLTFDAMKHRTGLFKTARGAVTMARRCGVGYFGYLIGGVAWPQMAYRFGWGPTAPPLLQGVFAAAGELTGKKIDPLALTRLRLLAPEGGGEPAPDAKPFEIERLMDRAHAAGLTGVARAFHTIVRMSDGTLRFGDLAAARKHQPGSVHFAAARDEDRRAFNREYGASLLTESVARDALKEQKAKVPAECRDYAPIDFGGGLTIGQIASTTDTGTGRWDFFNRQIVAPLVAGRRVLDLGSNNGSLPLMMLRSGAREVVAIEFTDAIADLARLNARILGWRDMRSYDIEVVTGDMRLFLNRDLGTFDVVTAFCSLYYVPEDDMARIIRKAASMNAVLILQANEAVDYLPAKTLDLHRLMRDNGYPEIAVHTPSGIARPLLVGYTQFTATNRYREAVARI